MDGQPARATRMQCDGLPEDDPFLAVRSAWLVPPTVEVVHESRLGEGAWSVGLELVEPGASQEITVEVHEEGGDYVVC